MLEKIIAFIKQILNWLWGRRESVAPSAPSEVTPPTPPTAVREPEMGIGAAVPPAYRQRESLFTYRERAFFRALLEDIENHYAVFAKVRLADVIWLANEPENRKYHNNQLHCKHFDYLLCEKGTYKPLLVIELDDSSHNKYEHRERDEFKDKVCVDIGLKMWRPRVQQTYARGFIAEQVRSHIQPVPVKPPA